MTPWTFVAAVLAVTAAVAVTGVAVVCVRGRRSRLRVTVAGESMAPALTPGQVVIAHRVTPQRLRAGDVVVLVKPERPGDWRWPEAGGPVGEGAWLLKRLAALPGDPVPPPVAASLGVTGAVPEGVAVVLGDNTAASVDSRDFGFVPVDRVIARVPR